MSPWAEWEQICKLFEEAGPLAGQGAAIELWLLPGAVEPHWSFGLEQLRAGEVGWGLAGESLWTVACSLNQL